MNVFLRLLANKQATILFNYTIMCTAIIAWNEGKDNMCNYMHRPDVAIYASMYI